uniref:Uncharacterized protein n=1 Tax=Trichuris muris TaxID=70415 RepID=A0A5S6QXW9_TRIMR
MGYQPKNGRLLFPMERLLHRRNACSQSIEQQLDHLIVSYGGQHLGVGLFDKVCSLFGRASKRGHRRRSMLCLLLFMSAVGIRMNRYANILVQQAYGREKDEVEVEKVEEEEGEEEALAVM